MKKNLIPLIFAVVLMVSFIACKTTGKKSTGNIEVGLISWVIERIEPSFWPQELEFSETMFITLFLPISENITLQDIESIMIYSPMDFWTLNSENIANVAEIENDKNRLVLKRLQSADGAIPIGEWNIKFKMKGQEAVSQQITVTSIDGEQSSGNSEGPKKIVYIVPESSSENEVSALAVPEIKSVSRDSDSIEIIFSVNDKRVKNGYFWFDVPGEKYYKDSGSMIDASGSPVNGCRKFSVDGKECRYILRKDAENSQWFNKIIAVHFVASDTNRVQSPWEEQYRSVSARVKVDGN